MAEYIEKAAFIAHIRKEVEGLQTKMPMDLVIEGVANEAKKFPAADVAPVRRGVWVPTPCPGIESGYLVVCSKCDAEIYVSNEFEPSRFCPNCGAKMDGEADE